MTPILLPNTAKLKKSSGSTSSSLLCLFSAPHILSPVIKIIAKTFVNEIKNTEVFIL